MKFLKLTNAIYFIKLVDNLMQINMNPMCGQAHLFVCACASFQSQHAYYCYINIAKNNLKYALVVLNNHFSCDCYMGSETNMLLLSDCDICNDQRDLYTCRTSALVEMEV